MLSTVHVFDELVELSSTSWLITEAGEFDMEIAYASNFSVKAIV